MQMNPSLIAPGVQIEALPAILRNTVRMNDLLSRCQQRFDDVGRIFDHVHVQPQNPRLVIKGVKE
jgi:hypothetical protein